MVVSVLWVGGESSFCLNGGCCCLAVPPRSPLRCRPGTRLDWYKNIPVPTSYMVCGTDKVRVVRCGAVRCGAACGTGSGGGARWRGREAWLNP